MADLQDRSPLVHSDEPLTLRVIAGHDVTLAEQPRRQWVRLECRETSTVQKAVTDIAGMDLPTLPGRALASDRGTALWLAPGSWLLHLAKGRAAEMCEAFGTVLGDCPHLALDQSHQFVTLSVAGAAAPMLLSKSCALDLDPAIFKFGHCARTLFGDIPLLIHRAGEDTAYDLVADQSLGRFLIWWFEEMMR